MNQVVARTRTKTKRRRGSTALPAASPGRAELRLCPFRPRLNSLYEDSRSDRHRACFAAFALCLLLAHVNCWNVGAATNATPHHGSGPGMGSRGMVVTLHPLATRAGLETLKAGGNAIDAAVAAGLMLGVVDGHNSGIGGGCFILMRTADGKLHAIDGREAAPAGATHDMFVREGRADPKLSQTGALAVAVPGALHAYQRALRSYGRFRIAEPLRRAADVADGGFELSAGYARALAHVAADLARCDAAAQIFLNADGTPRRAGERLRQPELAQTYRAIADKGLKWFYGGPFARVTADWMRAHGGLLTIDDFRRYRSRERTPIRTTYRGFQIVGFPPPSSGGVHVAQILNLIEPFEIGRFGADAPQSWHLLAEAMKLAFADRAHWLGDPQFAQVPRGLTGKPYAHDRGAGIRLEHAVEVPSHGTPPRADADLFGRHTTHWCTADAEGNWVACTATVNTSFGAKVVIPRTGVILNNEMDDFSAQPGVPNFFGLLGSEANAVEPRKRPLSSMSPTFVLKDGKPILAVGAAGGPTIISQVALAVVATLDWKLGLPAALALPRIHHQWRPDELIVETALPEATRDALARFGHRVRVVPSLGAAQAIALDAERRTFVGMHDPRLDGGALGY
jgi:gamma-glutamyltranspeptidase/glutathione hydrolase